MSDTYYTIQEEGEGQLREKLSRFIAYAHHIDSEEDARTYVQSLRNRYHDARHVCWAFATRDGRRLSQDDGEPSGTAGRPILGQIDSLGLTDVVVAVVRYFGGIKLGPSGLIAAYRAAARLALQSVPTVRSWSNCLTIAVRWWLIFVRTMPSGYADAWKRCPVLRLRSRSRRSGLIYRRG